MIFIYISILALVNAKAYEPSSYRSSVMDGSRPILRMLPEDPTELEESAEEVTPEEVTPEPVQKHEESHNEELAKELSLLVAWLVEKLGYNLVEDIRRLSDYPEKQATRTTKNEDSNNTTDTEPSWLMDLKSYMKDLVSQYGKKSLDKYTTPIVQSVENKENVYIKDIDGEVFVTYEKNTKKRSKPEKKPKKQSSEESEEASKVEHVTEMLQRRIFVKK